MKTRRSIWASVCCFLDYELLHKCTKLHNNINVASGYTNSYWQKFNISSVFFLLNTKQIKSSAKRLRYKLENISLNGKHYLFLDPALAGCFHLQGCLFNGKHLNFLLIKRNMHNKCTHSVSIEKSKFKWNGKSENYILRQSFEYRCTHCNNHSIKGFLL